MNCPKCNAKMHKVTFEGIEVDRCTDCQGIWFDLQEHQQLKQLPGAAEAIDTGYADRGRQMNDVRKINCPRDGVLLTRMVDLQQPHLWYEACPHCYGVFFDAGEFKDFSQKTLLESLRDLFPRARD
ncbi:MAG: zf-TFIIB domain-containing protein [Anaerolineae bacterium]